MVCRPKDSMKGKCYVFSGFKKRTKVCLVYLECLMYFQVKMPGKGRKNIFRDKQTTNKVPLMFLDVKVLTER